MVAEPRRIGFGVKSNVAVTKKYLKSNSLMSGVGAGGSHLGSSSPVSPAGGELIGIRALKTR